MKSIIKNIAGFICVIIGLNSCENINDVHEEYLKRGEEIYTGVVDSLEALLNFLIPMQKMPTAIMARSYGRIWIKARLWNVSVNIMVRTWKIRLPLVTV